MRPSLCNWPKPSHREVQLVRTRKPQTSYIHRSETTGKQNVSKMPPVTFGSHRNNCNWPGMARKASKPLATKASKPAACATAPTIYTIPTRPENRTFQKCLPSPLESIKNNCNWPGKRPNHWPGKRPNQPPALPQTTIYTGPKRPKTRTFQKCFPSPLESIKNNCNWPGKRPNHRPRKRPNHWPALQLYSKPPYTQGQDDQKTERFKNVSRHLWNP